MKLFKLIMQSLQRSKQREALYHLQSMSERQLIDCGFSPQLLSEGLKGWPWRADNAELQPSASESQLNIEQQHVSELQSYTDAELADLGICRGSIRDSVRNGRPGIERNLTDKAA